MADDDSRDADGATSEEKRPINSVERGDPDDATKVKTRTPPRNAGCYLTRGQATALAISFFILLCGVGIIVWILKPPPCYRPDGDGNWYSPTPKPTVDPSMPWSGIRLSDSLAPSFYTIELRVDLDKFIFSGSVEIEVLCRSETYYVTVHVNSLNITRSEVSIVDLDTGGRVEIYKQVSVPVNQFHVIQTTNSLEPGHRYKIRFGSFAGKLHDDLRGLYRSSYKDSDGNTR